MLRYNAHKRYFFNSFLLSLNSKYQLLYLRLHFLTRITFLTSNRLKSLLMKLFPTDLMNLGIKKFKDGLYLQTPKNMYYKYIKCFWLHPFKIPIQKGNSCISALISNEPYPSKMSRDLNNELCPVSVQVGQKKKKQSWALYSNTILVM